MSIAKRLNDAVEKLDRVATRSKSFEFDGSVLIVRDWFTGEKTMVDLKALAGVLHNLLDEGDEESVEMVLCKYEEEENEEEYE